MRGEADFSLGVGGFKAHLSGQAGATAGITTSVDGTTALTVNGEVMIGTTANANAEVTMYATVEGRASAVIGPGKFVLGASCSTEVGSGVSTDVSGSADPESGRGAREMRPKARTSSLVVKIVTMTPSRMRMTTVINFRSEEEA